MATAYTDEQKLRDAKRIARDGGCFVVVLDVQMQGKTTRKYLLYREATPRNQLVGKRMNVGALLKLTKDATKVVDTPH